MNRSNLYSAKQPRITLNRPQKPERFVIPHEVIEACPFSEVNSTIKDMESFGIAKLPFRDMVIELPSRSECLYMKTIPAKELSDDIAELLDYTPEQLATTRYVSQYYFVGGQHQRTVIRQASGTMEALSPDSDDRPGQRDLAEMMANLLIVLLATKNIRKDRVQNKLAKLGIGKNRFEYTTTLRLPAEYGESGHTRDGVAVRPHLRRGHKRDQWFPKAQVHKAIWIEPCFVNADEDFVSARTSYEFKQKEIAA